MGVQISHAAQAGTVSTAGGLVFAGDMDGCLIAVDAQSGEFGIARQAAVWASPMACTGNGRQFVTIPSNSTLFTFAATEVVRRANFAATILPDAAKITGARRRRQGQALPLHSLRTSADLSSQQRRSSL